MVEYPWGEERIYKKSAKAECSDYREKSHSSNTLNNLSNFQLSRLTTDEVEITGLVDFDSTGQLLIIYFSIVEYLKKIGNTMRQCTIHLQSSRNPMIQSGGG